MSTLPEFLQYDRSLKICLILEGYEEFYYFNKILNFPCFNRIYQITKINAKAASSVPVIYQAEFSKNIYDIVLVVCDKDRKPESYNDIIKKLDLIHGEGKGSKVVTFVSPCTLQIILLHFGDVRLETQAKKNARPHVKALTGVDNYDAHQDQLKDICNQIHYRSYSDMKERVENISTCPDDMPSTNILTLLENLESEDTSWIDDINKELFEED